MARSIAGALQQIKDELHKHVTPSDIFSAWASSAVRAKRTVQSSVLRMHWYRMFRSPFSSGFHSPLLSKILSRGDVRLNAIRILDLGPTFRAAAAHVAREVVATLLALMIQEYRSMRPPDDCHCGDTKHCHCRPKRPQCEEQHTHGHDGVQDATSKRPQTEHRMHQKSNGPP